MFCKYLESEVWPACSPMIHGKDWINMIRTHSNIEEIKCIFDNSEIDFNISDKVKDSLGNKLKKVITTVKGIGCRDKNKDLDCLDLPREQFASQMFSSLILLIPLDVIFLVLNPWRPDIVCKDVLIQKRKVVSLTYNLLSSRLWKLGHHEITGDQKCRG